MGEQEGWEWDRFDQHTLYAFMKFVKENNKNENPNFQRILVAAENALQCLLLGEARRGSLPEAGVVITALRADCFCSQINKVSIFKNSSSRDWRNGSSGGSTW